MAVSCTVTAIKIDITSTGGVQETWGTCVAAINAKVSGTITGAGTVGDPYTITAAAYRELEISNGCKILFEANTFTRWFWSATSGTYVILEFATGSDCVIEEGCEFDLGYTGTYRRGYMYTYGKLTITGTVSNPVIFKNYRSGYLYFRDDQDWDYVKFQDTTYSSGYMIWLSYSQYTSIYPTVNLNHITVENTNANYWGRVYAGYTSTMPRDELTLNNWHVEHLYYPIYSVSGSVKFTNSTFKDTIIQAYSYDAGNGIGLPFVTSKDKLANSKTFQPMNVFDTCTFDDLDNGVYAVYCYYPGRTLFKDCTFQNQSNGVYTSQGSIVLWEGTNTFVGIGTHRRWAYNATHLHVRRVKLTVQDVDGNPISQASVSLIQASSPSKEWHAGLTDSNGELKNVWGNDPILVEKEEVSTGVYQQWSNDTNNDLYHIITVAKKVIMLASKSVSAILDQLALLPTSSLSLTFTAVTLA